MTTPACPGMNSKKSDEVASAWTMPTMTPPRKAPGRLVMPPSTAAVKAGIRSPDVTMPGSEGVAGSRDADDTGEAAEQRGERPREASTGAAR